MTGFFDDEPRGNDQQSSGGASGPAMDPVSGVFAHAKGALDGVASMQKGAEQMVQVAKSGGFRTDPEGVKQLVKVCSNMIDELDKKASTFYRLAQEPKLDSSPYAKQVAQHVRLSADGPQGVVPQLDTFKRTLMALNEALYRASGQYAEADEAAKMRRDASA